MICTEEEAAGLSEHDKKVSRTSPPGWETIPGLLKRSTNTGSGAALVHAAQVRATARAAVI